MLFGLALDPVWEAALRWVVTAAYLAVVAAICLYGAHRYRMVLLFCRCVRQLTRPKRRFAQLPRVTVQVPLYNEAVVAERIIDAACLLDYPRDRLQVQVLDDSTDASIHTVRARVEQWRERGLDIELLHRDDRTGYKAGALAAAMASATGEFIAIFDADFVPRPGFLRRTIHHFTDAAVGMVQTRWAHLNRDDSLLTRGQAIFLDGHFVIEHTARNRSGAWINFNGTAGVWRREAIEAAGGWQHDTLTEDVDLSYRAQLAGYRFVFLPRYTCPAELPPQINAFKTQQHRWTKGSIQTAMKILPRLLRQRLPLRVKAEAFFHLTSPIVYLLIVIFTLLMYPVMALNLDAVGRDTWVGLLLGTTMFGLGTASAAVFYLASQHAQHRSRWQTLLQVPVLMALGVGIAVYNAIACLEALLGHQTGFVRTPKYNRSGETAHAGAESTEDDGGARPAASWLRLPPLKLTTCFLELALGLYVVACVDLAARQWSTAGALPFLAIFAVGYLAVGASSLVIHARRWMPARPRSWGRRALGAAPA